MDQNNRVYSRVGARELSPEELQKVGGAINTSLPCTILGRVGELDGECALP
jgi:hypothetical protein